MSIDVQHLAKLARLRIEDDKLAKFEKDAVFLQLIGGESE